jgi:hypothetical protein
MKQGETKLYVDIEEGKCFNAEDMNKDRQRWRENSWELNTKQYKGDISYRI